ncbi:MAG: signal peptidase I [Phycisphaerae bacterium]
MATQAEHPHGEVAAIRDTVESIWVAIVVAFVLRAFLIEAFVIPTGSMAPRLMGAHWQLRCRSCAYSYAFGLPKLRPGTDPRTVVNSAKCPNCNFPHNYAGENLCRGDQVLVMKYLYHFTDPQPYDVVVFKNPQNNRENYIKRLIGLPGETIEIVHGDIFVKDRKAGQTEFRIRRKPPKAQEAMWQVVFDNDYQPDESQHFSPDHRVPVPRWVPSEGSDKWQTANSGREFAFAGSEQPQALTLEMVWKTSNPRVRETLEDARRDMFLPHYGYNTRRSEMEEIDEDVDICTDLQLSAVYWPGDADSTLHLGLTSFDHEFRGEVSRDGTCRILYRHAVQTENKWVQWGDAAKIPTMTAGRGYAVSLSHVDLRVALRVNGREILARTDKTPLANAQAVKLMGYESLKAKIRMVRHHAEEIPLPRPSLAASGGPCRVNHLRLSRDVYYTTPDLRSVAAIEQDSKGRRQDRSAQLRYAAEEIEVEAGKPGWGTTGRPLELAYHEDRSRADLDEFFVVGDNSPQSLDGRGWIKAAPTLELYDQQGRPIYTLGTVPRYNILGKAFFVYWPAGFRFPGLPNLQILPNVGQMRLIR